MKKSILTILLFIQLVCIAQVGINTTEPETTLDVRAENHLGTVSSNDGVLVPRVNNLSISGSVNGQMVYLITNSGSNIQGFYYWNGSQWILVGSEKENWSILGNADTSINDNFIGTTDDNNLDIRINNERQIRFTQQGQIEFFNNGFSVFLGFNAGENDDGSNNQSTFVGYESGLTNTSGSANSFFGGSSGYSNNTGSNNSFFGVNSGYNNISGINNTFIGSSSGNGNTTGTNNSFFGAGSGSGSVDGRFNTFIGVDSGRSNASGERNTYVGMRSGANATGSDNVFIGYFAGLNESGSQKLYIENSNASIPLINGDFNINIVGINRIATTNTLEVGGSASKSTAGSWLANSDARLKKDVVPLDSQNSLNKLLMLQGISYKWDDNQTGYNRPKELQYGFTAQNIQEVLPVLVFEDAQGYLQTSYGTLDPIIIEAIREQNNKIIKLEDENKDLKNRLERLEQILLALMNK